MKEKDASFSFISEAQVWKLGIWGEKARIISPIPNLNPIGRQRTLLRRQQVLLFIFPPPVEEFAGAFIERFGVPPFMIGDFNEKRQQRRVIGLDFFDDDGQNIDAEVFRPYRLRRTAFCCLCAS